MDCSKNKGKPMPHRVQMPPPPCMDTNCSCAIGREPVMPVNQSIVCPGDMKQPGRMDSRDNMRQPRGMDRPGDMRQPYGFRTLYASVRSETSEPSMNRHEQSCSKREADFRRNQMPIAMAYVPRQKWCQTYPMEQGFQRGTIFPELDLPFEMGRC